MLQILMEILNSQNSVVSITLILEDMHTSI
nr:MAG TPA: hypothetical protein [Bacteriophage sp.]